MAISLAFILYAFLLVKRCTGYVGIGHQLIPHGLAPLCSKRVTLNLSYQIVLLLSAIGLIWAMVAASSKRATAFMGRVPSEQSIRKDLNKLTWIIDGLIALSLLILTIYMRTSAEARLNPVGTPYGSDWSTFLMAARAVDTEQWILYNPSKWPLYPILSAWAASRYNSDYAAGNQLVSYIAMTFTSPCLYLAVRLWLGRYAAIVTTLIFAVGGTYHYYAYATTSYGLFTGLTLLQTGCLAWAMSSAKWRAYALAGLAFALGFIAEIKTLTVALPLGAVALLNFVLQNRRSWSWYLVALSLLIGPSLGSLTAIQHWPVKLSSLEQKLKINEVDLIRKMNNWRWNEKIANITFNDHDEHLAPLSERIVFNLDSMRKELANGKPTYFLILAILGFFSPLLQRDERGWIERLRAMVGPLSVLALIASISGAVSLLYMKKYVIHALPFAIALAARGTWIIAERLTPLGAPSILKSAMALTLSLQLTAMNLPINGLSEPKMMSSNGLADYWDRALFRTDLREAALAKETAEWLNEAKIDSRRLLNCVRIHNEAFYVYLDKPPQLYIRPSPDEPVVELGYDCRSYLQIPAWRERWWLVDHRIRGDLREFIEAHPERFELKKSLIDKTELEPVHSVWIYYEPPSPDGKPPGNKKPQTPDIMYHDAEAMEPPLPPEPSKAGNLENP